jgi:hypothetical protein
LSAIVAILRRVLIRIISFSLLLKGIYKMQLKKEEWLLATATALRSIPKDDPWEMQTEVGNIPTNYPEEIDMVLAYTPKNSPVGH